MRKKIVAGNWKMNLTKAEAVTLYQEIQKENLPSNVEVMVFSPFLFLDTLINNKTTSISVGAQNFHAEAKGAFTGEVSYSQLLDLGIKHALVGHSERRILFQEDNKTIQSKVNAAISNDLQIIFCCGEPLDVRESGKHIEYVLQQLAESIFHLSVTDFQKIVIAYEPIWAIGTGKTATPEQAEEMHAAIRKAIASHYSTTAAESISILYGGSCNAKNAKELFSKPNIDGGLIGGASLKAEDFVAIITSF